MRIKRKGACPLFPMINYIIGKTKAQYKYEQ